MRIRIQESHIIADPCEVKKKQFIFLAVSLLLLYPLLFSRERQKRNTIFLRWFARDFGHKVITIRICFVRKREEYEQQDINMRSEKSIFRKGLE
jgi:hypothetical protein